MKTLFTILCAIAFIGNAICQAVTSISPANGNAYFSVTLQGTGLQGATQVKFGGTDAICFYANPAGTKIIALAPPGISTGPISVVTPKGTVLSPAFNVIPAADPAADFASIDKKPQSYEKDWCNSTGGTWGPHRRNDFATPMAPQGVDPGDWARARVMAAAFKWRYLPYQHHHVPDFDGTKCPNLASSAQMGPGLDCSNYTSFVYQYTFNYSINSAITTQESSSATGRLLTSNEALLPGDLMFCMGSPSGPNVTHVVIYIDPIHRIDEHAGSCDIRTWGSGGWPYNSWKSSRRPLDMINITTGDVSPTEKGNKKILVYPNPTSSYITLAGIEKNDLLSIYNYVGQLINQKTVQMESGTETIYVGDLKAGIYMISVNYQSDSSLRFQKL